MNDTAEETLRFQALRSGSSANCSVLSTGTSCIMVDAGFPSQSACREALDYVQATFGELSGAILTHSHSDHVRLAPLKILHDRGIPIWVHKEIVKEITHKHLDEDLYEHLVLNTFSDYEFSVGEFSILPIALEHDPRCNTHGFVVRNDSAAQPFKVVVAMDFYKCDRLKWVLPNSDLIFIESDYDAELLLEKPNFNSRWHLENEDAAEMVAQAVSASYRWPQAVILGHLSDERNRPKKAIRALNEAMKKHGVKRHFRLLTAKRDKQTIVITLKSTATQQIPAPITTCTVKTPLQITTTSTL